MASLEMVNLFVIRDMASVEMAKTVCLKGCGLGIQMLTIVCFKGYWPLVEMVKSACI